jgi:DNA-binding CsgD family transcriptional regulator
MTVRSDIRHPRAVDADGSAAGRGLLGRAEECAALDRLLADAFTGAGGVLVLRGEAGVGRSALLAHARRSTDGWHVASGLGVESETGLAFSGLHQLCAPMLQYLELLPEPQRTALEIVFGLRAGPPPDHFVVGLATLTLFQYTAEQLPLLCVIDDAHWLDDDSARILGFVARRLHAVRVALLFSVRAGGGDAWLAGLPELCVHGLDERDLHALLLQHVHGPLDPEVRDQIVEESHGNPLALLELTRMRRPADLAGGFGLPDTRPISGEIEQQFAGALLELPSDTRLLVLAAAAEPQGDPVLLYRAARMLGLGPDAVEPAREAGLLTLGRRVAFPHPVARFAVYRAATADDRMRVHRALAEATDAETDPDRRVWHRALATAGPSEQVAAELERSAGHGQARGGLAAAAAFLQHAVARTLDPVQHVDRALAAAEASVLAGSFDAALALTAAAEAGAFDELQRARAALVRGAVAFASALGGDATPLLLTAARRLEPFDARLAREACLDAWGAAFFTGRPGALLEVSGAARAIASPPGTERPSDLLVDGLATLVIDGRAAAVPALKRATIALAADDPAGDNLRWGWSTAIVSSVLWDDEAWHTISERQLLRTRGVGALVRLPTDLTTFAMLAAWEGDLARAASAIDEAHAAAAATGTRLAPDGAMLLAALRGQEDEAAAAVAAALEEAAVWGRTTGARFAHWVAAVLFNGLGRYEDALAAAQAAAAEGCDLCVSSWALAELVEAGVRSRARRPACAALARLIEVAAAAGTDWALGIEARCRALVADGATAEAHYREAIDRLGRTRVRTERARAHLVYGEWLRREGRRVDARAQLRTAHAMFGEIGMEAFAERARRELVATGEKARKRTSETRDRLTAQEEQIARLARAGLSNPEIGAQLFISARTVEWHLRKVFVKLGVTSRKELRKAISDANVLVPS